VQGPAWKILWFAVFFQLGVGTAQAHDPLQGNTNIWLRQDEMEVDIDTALVFSRSLVDNAPAAGITEDNFESAYHALFLKSAPSMLEISLDGKKLEPRFVEVAPIEESDIQFKFVYDRPADGRLRITAFFVKKMDEGYVNTLVLNDEHNLLGYGEQTADNPVWEINLGKDTGIRSPSASSSVNLSPAPPSSPVVTPPAPTPEVAAKPGRYFVSAFLAVIIFLAIWLIRRKSSS
jgi:hypothetical protein